MVLRQMRIRDRFSQVSSETEAIIGAGLIILPCPTWLTWRVLPPFDGGHKQAERHLNGFATESDPRDRLHRADLPQPAPGLGVPDQPPSSLRVIEAIMDKSRTISMLLHFGLLGIACLAVAEKFIPLFPSYVLLMLLGLTVSDGAMLAMTSWRRVSGPSSARTSLRKRKRYLGIDLSIIPR